MLLDSPCWLILLRSSFNINPIFREEIVFVFIHDEAMTWGMSKRYISPKLFCIQLEGPRQRMTLSLMRLYCPAYKLITPVIFRKFIAEIIFKWLLTIS